MKGTKCGFTVHDQEQICQKNRVHIFSDLGFGNALTTGSKTQHRSKATARRNFCVTHHTSDLYIILI
jgi:hypothetical protein